MILLPGLANAAYHQGVCGESALWTLDGNTLTISGNGDMYNWSPRSAPTSEPGWQKYKDDIVNVVITEGVVTIGDNAFYEYTNLKYISLPEGLTYIGNYAFYGCTLLEEVNFPSTLKMIGLKAMNYSANGFSFSNCSSLKSITLPESLELIGVGAFNGCGMLKTLNWDAVECDAGIMDAVNRFTGAFYGTGITHVNFGEKVKSIPAKAFYSVASVSDISTKGSIEFVGEYAFTGTLWAENQPTSQIIYIDNAAALYKTNPSLTDLFEIDIRPGTKGLSPYLFENQVDLYKATIPESVEWFYENTFKGCTALTEVNWNPVSLKNTLQSAPFSASLTKINFGSKVTDLPAHFLEGATLMKTVQLPESLQAIGKDAFKKCNSLTELTIPDATTDIASGAFNEMANLEELTIGKGVKNLDYSYFCFLSPKLKHINWNAIKLNEINFDITSTGNHCCAPIESLVFGDDVEVVPVQLFSRTPVTDVIFGANIKRLGTGAFHLCDQLNHIDLPDGLEIIDDYSLSRTRLQEVFIPSSVMEIGMSGFYECYDLKKVISAPSIAPLYGGHAFNAKYIEAVYVPDLERYGNDWWANGENLIQMATSEVSDYEYNDGNPIDFNFTCNLPEYSIESYSCTNADAYTLGEHSSKIEITFDGPRPFTTSFNYKYNVSSKSGIAECHSTNTQVYTKPNAIVVDNTSAKIVAVYDLAGICLYKGAPDTISVPKGIYLVSVDGVPYKAMVR